MAHKYYCHHTIREIEFQDIIRAIDKNNGIEYEEFLAKTQNLTLLNDKYLTISL